jgi:primosomal protein N' (replication factor Y) (superfamily II helicase)
LWNKATSLKHPVLVVATPQFMSLTRPDLKILIVEKENSSAYKELRRPFLDMRVFAELLTKKLGIRLLFGDIILRTETIWRQKNLEFAELSSIKFRSISTANQKMIDMKKEDIGGFPVISKELGEIIGKALEKQESTFIFCARKGLFPIIACRDCGRVQKCRYCNAPATLQEKNSRERILICNKCGKHREVGNKCEHCASWRLEGLGVGVELIEKKLKEKFPEAKVLRLDKDVAKTSRGAANIIGKFYSSPGSILVGSELALLYLVAKVDHIAAASIDSLFSIPDFRISEKILSSLLRMRSMARKNFIIQSRHGNLSLWKYALGGSLIDFYREEVKLREALNYPPFSLLIKITLKGEERRVEKEMEALDESFKKYKPHTYPAFISKVKGKYIMHALIKYSTENWPDKTLVEKLSSLPPKFLVKVDPDTIL